MCVAYRLGNISSLTLIEQIGNWAPVQQDEQVLIVDTSNLNQPYQAQVIPAGGFVDLLFQPTTGKAGLFTFAVYRQLVPSAPSSYKDLGSQLQRGSTSNLTFQWWIENVNARIASIFPTSADISVINDGVYTCSVVNNYMFFAEWSATCTNAIKGSEIQYGQLSNSKFSAF